MKICMIPSGAYDYSVALTNGLSKYCQIDFYCSRYHIAKGDLSILDVLADNVQILCYGKYRIRDIRNVSVYYDLCKNIRRRHYDIIHIQANPTPWMALFWRLCKQTSLVMTVHDPYQHPGLPYIQKLYQDVMQRIFVNRAKKLIVHGNLLKRQVLERYDGKVDDDVVVLPHGDFSIMKHWDNNRDPRPTSNSMKNILFFGTVRPNKGLEYLLKAEPYIREHLKNYRIIVAGRCDHYDRYVKYISDRIHIVNKYIPNKDVCRYFRQASVVVLPYLSATQTGIIPLAYSFGKPVIATNVGAIPEVVENGSTGILVEPRNEKTLADAIVSLLSDNNLIEEMGRNALLYCKRNLSWDSIAKKTMNLYSELTQGK